MKLKFFLSRRTISLIIVIFVLAGAAVGFLSESQNPYGPGATPSVPGFYPSGPAQPSQPTAVTMYAATTSAVSGPSSYGGRMVELEGYLTLEVSNQKAVTDQASNLASSLGGYVASSSFDQSGSSSNLVLRIPQQNFTLALHKLGELGKVTSQSVSSNDVTEEYVNLQAQLDAYEIEAATLLRIMNSSKSVTDALSTEEQIQQVQANINQIQGELQVMQRLVAFATINLQLTAPPVGPELDLGDVIQSAVFSFYLVLKGMFILGAALAPIGLVGGVAYYPYKYLTKKRQKPSEANLAGTA